MPLRLTAKDYIFNALYSLAITDSLNKSGYNYLLRENGNIMRKGNKNSICSFICMSVKQFFTEESFLLPMLQLIFILEINLHQSLHLSQFSEKGK